MIEYNNLMGEKEVSALRGHIITSLWCKQENVGVVVDLFPSPPLTIHRRCVQGFPPPPYLCGYTPSLPSHAGRVLLVLIPLHQVA